MPRLDARAVHFVDLFETETFGFGDTEPHVDKAKGEHAKEDEQNEWADATRRGEFITRRL